MIIEINLSNLDLLENSFLSKETIKKELENNPFAKVLVYIKEDNIIGYLYYSNIYDRIEINQIEVLPEYRRNSVASTLLKQIINDNKKITLEVREDNIGAIKLYEKFSFQKVAIRKNYYGSTDGILMEKSEK